MTRLSPSGPLRWLFRAPIILYRLRLGWLLGKRFLLLQHTGRKSGRQRQTVLEVLRYDRENDRYLVASAFGEQAQWFQNIMHDPAVQLAVGGGRLAAQAVRLPQEEATRELVRYARAHPWATRLLSRFLGLAWDGSAEGAGSVARQMPIIALEVG